MARLRQQTSYNKCASLVKTMIRLEIEDRLRISRFDSKSIAIPHSQIGMSRSLSSWYKRMYLFNLKRFKDDTKRKQSFR